VIIPVLDIYLGAVFNWASLSGIKNALMLEFMRHARATAGIRVFKV